MRCSEPLARYEMTSSQHVYEVRPRKDQRGVDLISDVLPFGRLWYGEPNAISNAIGYAKFYSRSRDALIRVYDATGKKIPLKSATFFMPLPQRDRAVIAYRRPRWF
jgi:hypothetical protein